MTVDTDICNRALAAIGSRSTIASLNENSAEARVCRQFYTSTRDAVLRSAHWNCARKVAYLSLVKSLPGTPENTSSGAPAWNPAWPPPPWLYEYAYPSDCLQMRYISPQLFTTGNAVVPTFSVPSLGAVPPFLQVAPQRFLVGLDTDTNGNQTRVVLTNQDQAIGIYTAQVTIPDLWDSTLIEAMVASLAVRICVPISGDKKMKEDARQEAAVAIQQARLSDGNEGWQTQDHIPDWIRTRGVGLDWMGPATDGLVGAWSTPSFLML